MKTFLKSLVVSVLTFEAKLLLKRTRPKIIAITGSVGKTSTKDAIYHVLKGQVKARKSEKSFNSEIGVPLSVLGLDNAWSNPVLWLKNIVDGLFQAAFPHNYPEVLVLEMGVDRPGDMKKLVKWIKPDVVVLTRLPEVPVHVEYFGSAEAVIQEKLTLVDALREDGVLVYNHDDEWVRQAAAATRQRCVGYSRYSPSDFFAAKDKVIYEKNLPYGTRFNITHNEESAEFNVLGAVGVGQIYTLTAAAAVASLFDIDLSSAAKRLEDFSPPPGRMRLILGIKDTMIIDDTYNSSPVALEKALATLEELKGFQRKIAVLGDMLELGRFSISEHEQAGKQAAKCADVLVTVGVRARRIAEGAQAGGMSEKNIFQYEGSIEAGRDLQNYIEPGDILLIKGSQGMRMERIVEDIMRHPEDAPGDLVRQSTTWRSID